MNHENQEKDELIFGIRAVMEAIYAGKEIERVLIKKGLDSELFREFFDLVRSRNLSFQFVPVEKLNRVTRKNHQGVVAFISPISFYKIEDLLPGWFEQGKLPLVLVLDQISDVRNFGAIVRTAECAGVDAVVIPEQGTAKINADAVKTSAGALLVVPVCRVKNMVDACMYLQHSGMKIIAATEKSNELYTSADLTGPVAIVMGSEDKGIDRRILSLADQRVKIPVLGKIESLNVSVAAALMVYEAVRQRL
jgi:23S rRNA (guanosine2251-2'-O)-methyltransferase